MKQKIVIMVSIPCGKRRTKAMTLAAAATGVISVGMTGDYADRLEVVGDDVDVACLVDRLRKKVGRAKIIEVKEVKAEKPEEKKKPEEKNPEEKKKPEEKNPEAKKGEEKKLEENKPHSLPKCYPGCYHCPSVPQCYPGCYHLPLVPRMVINDEYDAFCSVM